MAAATVQIHLYAAARAAVGSSEVVAEPGALEGIIDRLVDEHPSFATVRPRCSYLVDGVAAHGDQIVPAGARVDVLPPFAGG